MTTNILLCSKLLHSLVKELQLALKNNATDFEIKILNAKCKFAEEILFSEIFHAYDLSRVKHYSEEVMY